MIVIGFELVDLVGEVDLVDLVEEVELIDLVIELELGLVLVLVLGLVLVLVLVFVLVLDWVLGLEFCWCFLRVEYVELELKLLMDLWWGWNIDLKVFWMVLNMVSGVCGCGVIGVWGMV